MTCDSQRRSWRKALLWLAFLTVAIGLLVPNISLDTNRHRPHAEARSFVNALLSATNAYAARYGSPVGGSHAQILATLRGKNPREIIFFDTGASRFNVQGELIDPWGTPYRFDLSKPDASRVWSCGSNRKDENGAEGSDDIVSWR